MEAIFTALLFVAATAVGVVWVILYLLIPFFVLRIRNEMIKLNKAMQKVVEERR